MKHPTKARINPYNPKVYFFIWCLYAFHYISALVRQDGNSLGGMSINSSDKLKSAGSSDEPTPANNKRRSLASGQRQLGALLVSRMWQKKALIQSQHGASFPPALH